MNIFAASFRVGKRDINITLCTGGFGSRSIDWMFLDYSYLHPLCLSILLKLFVKNSQTTKPSSAMTADRQGLALTQPKIETDRSFSFPDIEISLQKLDSYENVTRVMEFLTQYIHHANDKRRRCAGYVVTLSLTEKDPLLLCIA